MAELLDRGTFHGLLTLVSLVGFVALTAWAWSSRRRETYERAARLPLADDARPTRDPDREREDAR